MNALSLAELSPVLDDRLDRILEDSRVPGAAIAVVRSDRHFVKTWGVRRAGDAAKVTPHTAFDLGSCSKSYLAAVVARLVEEKRLGFDDPVQRYLPELELDRPEFTEALTIRDLLCNRIGLKRQIPVESFANPEISPLEIMRRVRSLDRLHPFRQGYVYFNPGFMAARLIVERVTGAEYGDVLRDKVFAPLGMLHSASGSARVTLLDDRACAHVLWDGAVREVHEDLFDNWQGAAGVHSCAADALRWLAFQLAGPHLETHRPHTPIPRAECKLIHAPPEADGADYCLGWWRTQLHGQGLVQHAGEMIAWRAYHAVVPEKGIGVAVMLSMGAPRHAALAYTVLEHLLAGQSRDWCAVADSLQADLNAATRRQLEAAFPITTAAALPLDRYAGTYAHPALGLVTVEPDGDGMRLQFLDGRLWGLALRPIGAHVFESRPLSPAVVDYFPVPLRLRFEVGQGRVTALVDLQARYTRKDDA